MAVSLLNKRLRPQFLSHQLSESLHMQSVCPTGSTSKAVACSALVEGNYRYDKTTYSCCLPGRRNRVRFLGQLRKPENSRDSLLAKAMKTSSLHSGG
jgi:hypothetical protein